MSAANPLITIITPTFNAGRHIEKCLESVQAQNFRDFEHLVLDGLSTDDTVAKVESWKQKANNIRLESAKDKGVYDAMNKGIALAKGKWLYFLGADDYLYRPGTLEAIAGELDKNDAHIVYGDVFFQTHQRVYDHEFDIEKILTRNICHQSIFYRSDVFKVVGGYDMRYRMESDYDLNLKCWLNRSIRHRYVEETIAFYAEGGLSSTSKDEVFISDYPTNTISATLAGNWGWFTRMRILSMIFRKLLIRPQYKGRSKQFLFASPQRFLRLSAFLWMCLSSPLHLFGSKKK